MKTKSNIQKVYQKKKSNIQNENFRFFFFFLRMENLEIFNGQKCTLLEEKQKNVHT